MLGPQQKAIGEFRQGVRKSYSLLSTDSYQLYIRPIRYTSDRLDRPALAIA